MEYFQDNPQYFPVCFLLYVINMVFGKKPDWFEQEWCLGKCVVLWRTSLTLKNYVLLVGLTQEDRSISAWPTSEVDAYWIAWPHLFFYSLKMDFILIHLITSQLKYNPNMPRCILSSTSGVMLILKSKVNICKEPSCASFEGKSEGG